MPSGKRTEFAIAVVSTAIADLALLFFGLYQAGGDWTAVKWGKLFFMLVVTALLTFAASRWIVRRWRLFDSENVFDSGRKERMSTTSHLRVKPKSRVFISHSSRDKPFVQRLTQELERHHLQVWFDAAEIKIGESIVEKVSNGLREADYLIVVLSKAAVESPWVQRELNSALMQQISDQAIAVLPILIEDCEIPTLLRDRLYADFRTDFQSGVNRLLVALSQEGQSAEQINATGPGKGTPAAPCTATLSSLSLGDLRRRITKRMNRSEIGAVWFDIVERRMDDDMANRPIVDCVIELLDSAKNRNCLGKLIDDVCDERPDLASP